MDCSSDNELPHTRSPKHARSRVSLSQSVGRGDQLTNTTDDVPLKLQLPPMTKVPTVFRDTFTSRKSGEGTNKHFVTEQIKTSDSGSVSPWTCVALTPGEDRKDEESVGNICCVFLVVLSQMCGVLCGTSSHILVSPHVKPNRQSKHQ